MSEDSDRGLYEKYAVFKDGEKVEDCFVLEPDDDPDARDALMAYAQSTENDALANDLIDWMSRYSHTGSDRSDVASKSGGSDDG